MSYPQLACEILSLFADDINAADLKRIVERSYTSEIFHSADITPVRASELPLYGT